MGLVMNALADHGVPLILEAHDRCELRRRTDWVDMPAEGEWLLKCAEAGDD